MNTFIAYTKTYNNLIKHIRYTMKKFFVYFYPFHQILTHCLAFQRAKKGWKKINKSSRVYNLKSNLIFSKSF